MEYDRADKEVAEMSKIKVNEQRAVDEFQELTAIDAPSFGERQMADRLIVKLKELGFEHVYVEKRRLGTAAAQKKLRRPAAHRDSLRIGQYEFFIGHESSLPSGKIRPHAADDAGVRLSRAPSYTAYDG